MFPSKFKFKYNQQTNHVYGYNERIYIFIYISINQSRESTSESTDNVATTKQNKTTQHNRVDVLFYHIMTYVFVFVKLCQ